MGTYRTYENIKAVILDMDGTLLDTVLDMLEAVNHAMDTAGHPRITYKEFQPLIGGGIRDIYKHCWQTGYRKNVSRRCRLI